MLESQLPSFDRPTPKKGPDSSSGSPPAPASEMESQRQTPPASEVGSVSPQAEGAGTLPLPPRESPPAPRPVPETPIDATLASAGLRPSEPAAPFSDPTQGKTVHTGQRARAVKEAPVPVEFPGYRVMGELGKGGMGVVYKAMQVGLNRLVALKMIRRDRATDEAIARFQVEAEAVAKIRHPNIVQVYDIGEHEGQPYFSLEYVDGGSLDRLVQSTPQLPRESAQVVMWLARAMHVAHAEQVIHRDLKPANILLQRAPGAPRCENNQLLANRVIPKITDFGLAKRIDETDLGQTHAGAVLGTPCYMAPEQAEGWQNEIGPWTDTYALGAILYELLVGRPPFKGATLVETLDQVRHTEPVPPRTLQPGVPRDLDTICLKCLNKSPGSRYRTSGELADDLQRYLDGLPIQARPVSRRERLVKWARRSPMAATAVGLGVLCVLSVIGILFVLMQVAQGKADRLEEEARVNDNFVRLVDEAEQTSRTADLNDTDTWRRIEQTVKSADELANAHPALKESHKYEVLAAVRKDIEGAQATARGKAEAAEKLVKLRQLHDDAVVFSVLFTGLSSEENFGMVRQAVESGLSQFGINTDHPRLPELDPRFYTASERRAVADWCQALLLFRAEAEARQAGPNEPQEARRAAAREALRWLDRADEFHKGQPGNANDKPGWASLKRRASYFLMQGDSDAARAAESLASQTPRQTALDSFLSALDLFNAGNYRDATSHAGDALSIEPTHFGARYLSTLCTVQTGNLRAAAVGLKALLDDRPDFIWVRLLRGYVQMELGQLDEAEKDFDPEKARQASTGVFRYRHPKLEYVAMVNHGVLAARRQDWNQAVSDVEGAIRLIQTEAPAKNGKDLTAATIATAYANLAVIHKLSAGTPGQGEAVLVSLGLRGHPGACLAATVSAGTLVVQQRRPERLGKALAALDQAIRHGAPNAYLLYGERARVRLDLNRTADALADLKEAVRLADAGKEGPPPVFTERMEEDRLLLCDLLSREGDHPRVTKLCEELIQRGRRPDAWRVKAQAELAQGRTGPARRSLENYLLESGRQRGKRLSPEDEAEICLRLGVLYARTREYRRAIAWYTQGLQLYPPDDRPDLDPRTRKRLAQLLTLRGWAYLGDDAANPAARDFDEAVALDSAASDARLGRADTLIRQGELLQAVEEADLALGQGERTSRLLYSAARIHAQAYDRHAGGARPRSVTQQSANAWGDRAILLLGEALEAEDADQRAAFWKQYVAVDGAFDRLRRHPLMERLATRFSPPSP